MPSSIFKCDGNCYMRLEVKRKRDRRYYILLREVAARDFFSGYRKTIADQFSQVLHRPFLTLEEAVDQIHASINSKVPAMMRAWNNDDRDFEQFIAEYNCWPEQILALILADQRDTLFDDAKVIMREQNNVPLHLIPALLDRMIEALPSIPDFSKPNSLWDANGTCIYEATRSIVTRFAESMDHEQLKKCLLIISVFVELGGFDNSDCEGQLLSHAANLVGCSVETARFNAKLFLF